MGKKLSAGPNLLLALLMIGTFLVGACSSQGMGDTKYYDWMGTPIISGSQGTVVYTDWREAISWELGHDGICAGRRIETVVPLIIGG